MKVQVLRKYAELIVKVGANVQKGQDVIIYAELDQPRFVEFVVSEAYKAGAKSVTVRWSHNPVDKIRYKKESLKSLSEVPNWIIEREKHYVKTLPATIYLVSDDPDAYKGVNQAKLAKVGQAVYPILKPFRDERENKYQWTIAGLPGPLGPKRFSLIFLKRKPWKNYGEQFLQHPALTTAIQSPTGAPTTPIS
jgi:aminopeptidase